MDKVYVLTLIDVSDGVQLTNKVEVYANYDKAKLRFDIEIQEYLDDNDFSGYIINKSENDFSVYKKYEYMRNHIEIHIIEKYIIK